MLTPSLRSSLLHRPSMLAKRRAMPMTSRYRTLISPPSCADECPASGHRVSASPTALPGATAVSGNRSTSYGNVSSRSTKSWCTALRGSTAGTAAGECRALVVDREKRPAKACEQGGRDSRERGRAARCARRYLPTRRARTVSGAAVVRKVAAVVRTCRGQRGGRRRAAMTANSPAKARKRKEGGRPGEVMGRRAAYRRRQRCRGAL